MKKIILVLAGSIMFTLIIATVFYYQNSKEITQLNNLRGTQAPQSEIKQPHSEQLQPIDIDETITYSLQNDKVNITFNKGSDWIEVPVEKDQLFEGEYNGDKQVLIENSYILSENRVAFLYSINHRITLIYSNDQGKTWEESLVTGLFPVMRFRKVDFLNENFGYIIISGDRTMSQEASHVYLTHDGGKSWEETNNSGVTRLMSDGAFIDELTGFLSFGTINPVEPDLYVTEDGGNSWSEAVINVPEKYHQIFVIAETPVKVGEELTVLLNQGPNGDYEGGRVKGKFVSNDNGKTWSFQKEVQPNETE